MKTEAELEQELDDVEISIMTMDGKLFATYPFDHLSSGEHKLKIDLTVSGHPVTGMVLMLVKSKQMLSVTRIIRP